MIGTLTLTGGRKATLEDDQAWASDDPALAAHLNAVYGPGRHEVGDHHVPPGVPNLNRAAADLGGTVELAVEPFPPLPPKTVS